MSDRNDLKGGMGDGDAPILDTIDVIKKHKTGLDPSIVVVSEVRPMIKSIDKDIGGGEKWM